MSGQAHIRAAGWKERFGVKKRVSIRVITIACCIWAAFGWWGALYPALAMPPDTYRIVGGEDGEALQKEASGESRTGKSAWDFDGVPYFEILRAGPEKVRFKSKLWMKLQK